MSEFSDITVIKSTGPGDVLWDKSRAAGTAEEHDERLAAEVGHACTWAEHTGLGSISTTLSYSVDVQELWKLCNTRRMSHDLNLKISLEYQFEDQTGGRGTEARTQGISWAAVR